MVTPVTGRSDLKSKLLPSKPPLLDSKATDGDAGHRMIKRPDDKVEPQANADNQSKIEPESKATDGDAGHRKKRLEEQVAALKTTTIRQEGSPSTLSSRVGCSQIPVRVQSADSQHLRR